MNDNPYSKIVSIMRKEGARDGPSSFFVGEVKAGLPNLEVNLNGLKLDKDDLMIDQLLLDGNVLVAGDLVVMVCLGEKYAVISKVVDI